MQDLDNIRSLWIKPDGEVLTTSHPFSHIKALNELNLVQTIRESASKIDFSPKELKTGLSNDITYLALKLGYIRVTFFCSEVNIDIGMSIETLPQDCSISLKNLIMNTRDPIIVLNNLETNEVRVNTCDQFLNMMTTSHS